MASSKGKRDIHERVCFATREFQVPLGDLASRHGPEIAVAALAMCVGTGLAHLMQSGHMSAANVEGLIEKLRSVAFDLPKPPGASAGPPAEKVA